jgi:hypothetical protein
VGLLVGVLVGLSEGLLVGRTVFLVGATVGVWVGYGVGDSEMHGGHTQTCSAEIVPLCCMRSGCEEALEPEGDCEAVTTERNKANTNRIKIILELFNLSSKQEMKFKKVMKSTTKVLFHFPCAL